MAQAKLGVSVRTQGSKEEPKAVVLSVGGSVLLAGDDDAGYLERLSDLIRRVSGEFPLAVTVGGGRVARDYIELGRRLGFTEIELDELGIEVTRINARLLAAKVGAPAPLQPPHTVAAAVQDLARGSPVILGGTEPGHTTDGVAALLAARVRASRLVNATRVDGLYTDDPRSNPDARRREKVSWADFIQIVAKGSGGQAGQEFVFDRLGAETLARSKIPLAIVNGRDLPNLENALRGRSFDGTKVDG